MSVIKFQYSTFNKPYAYYYHFTPFGLLSIGLFQDGISWVEMTRVEVDL